jgi:tetratricopeptide (TPR) repeat protein
MFEKDYSDIMDLQRELCRSIVRSIRIAVMPVEAARLAERRIVNPHAFDLYLRGVSVWLAPRESLADCQRLGAKALDCFREAVRLDPDLAPAYAWMGEITLIMAANHLAPERESYIRAREDITRALSLDTESAQAHSTLGFLELITKWDFAASENETKRSLELELGNPWLQYCYFDFLFGSGRYDEAINVIKPLVNVP